MNSDEKIIHVLDEFEDEDTESFDLLENNIEYIVADWTNKNDEILSALESYERNGVPLYVYWKPGMQKSEILPAILTEKIVLDALR